MAKFAPGDVCILLCDDSHTGAKLAGLQCTVLNFLWSQHGLEVYHIECPAVRCKPGAIRIATDICLLRIGGPTQEFERQRKRFRLRYV